MSALGSSLRRCKNWARLLLVLSLGCGDGESAARDAGPAHAEGDASPAARRVKPHTVRIELFKTTTSELEQAADGSLREGAPTDLEGVEVCAAKQRPAFASFQPFMDLEPPVCATSVEGQTVLLSGLPANSDLVITLSKDGYGPRTITFRTDDYDVAAPAWGSVTNGLGREGALSPWLEPEPRASAGDGVVSIGAVAVWAGAEFRDVTPAQGVRVEIEDKAGLALSELSTLRERSLLVSLPAGSYALRFVHPRMNIRPVGATAQYLIAGLSTDELDTIEVPVLAGHQANAAVEALCRAPRWDQGVDDLATCTLAPAGDAGTR